MKQFPHLYTSNSSCKPSGPVITKSRECPQLNVAEPEEFGGHSCEWSPEQLFVSTVANCLLLTFRAIANASKYDYIDLSCVAEGKLDRIDGINQFTHIKIEARLLIEQESDMQKGLRLLTKAENQCLIKNSISSEVNFANEVIYTQITGS